MSIVKRSLHAFRVRHHHVRLIFFICLIALSSSAMFLYYVNFFTSQNLLISQMQRRQLVINRAGKLAVNQFFTMTQMQVIGLASVPDIINQVPGRTQEVLDEVFQTHTGTQSPLFALVFINSSGTITAISDVAQSKATIGQNFADREYFIWTKDVSHKGQVYLSDPFISRGRLTQGKAIFVMTSPVFSANGKYQGAIGAVISFDSFVDTYLKPLSESQPELWFVARDGTFLAGGGGDEKPFTNLFSYVKDHQWANSNSFVSGLHDILDDDEDAFHWTYRTPGGQIKDVYGAGTKIPILNKDYWLIISNSKEQILMPLNGSLPLDIIPLVAVFATVIIGIVFVVVSRIAERDGYIAGYTAAQKEYVSSKKRS